MNNTLTFILLFAITITFSGCDYLNKDFRHNEALRKQQTILIQRINTTDIPFKDGICSKIKEDYQFGNIIIADNKIPPKEAINYEKGFRYAASYLLNWLAEEQPDTIALTVGFTNTDIYITKRDKNGNTKHPAYKYKVWGIFGLAKCPGTSCIISTHRLKSTNSRLNRERLIKVIMHEIGHNLGLKHCENKKCYMTDAVETIKTIDDASMEMCSVCKGIIGAE